MPLGARPSITSPAGGLQIKRPFLTAVPRDCQRLHGPGRKDDAAEPNKRMLPKGLFCTPVPGLFWKPIDTRSLKWDRRPVCTIAETANCRASLVLRSLYQLITMSMTSSGGGTSFTAAVNPMVDPGGMPTGLFIKSGECPIPIYVFHIPVFCGFEDWINTAGHRVSNHPLLLQTVQRLKTSCSARYIMYGANACTCAIRIRRRMSVCIKPESPR